MILNNTPLTSLDAADKVLADLTTLLQTNIKDDGILDLFSNMIDDFHASPWEYLADTYSADNLHNETTFYRLVDDGYITQLYITPIRILQAIMNQLTDYYSH